MCNKEGHIDSSKGFIEITYDEILSSTNQEFKLTIAPFSGRFVNGKEYFITVMKEKDKISKDWVSVLRTEKLLFNESLSPWKQISIPLDCLLSSKEYLKNEHDLAIKLEISQFSESGTHSICGYKKATLGRLISGDTLLELDKSVNTKDFIQTHIKIDDIFTAYYAQQQYKYFDFCNLRFYCQHFK